MGLASVMACVGMRPPEAPKRETSLGIVVSSFELTNDLRVVLVQDPRASEVQVTMRYQVGAVDDPAEQGGVAHLVEHLMFQQVVDGRSIFSRLDDVAPAFNATTTFDATTYVERSDPVHLDELLAIEAARLAVPCTSLSDSTFVREREVVVNELRQRSYASEIVEQFYGALYPAGHPYRRSPGGSEASVAKITKQQACAFAFAHYAPGNAVLVVSGNLTLDRLQGAVAPLGHVGKRAVTTRVPVAAVTAKGERVESPAPIDDELVMVAWPLPLDLRERAKVRAVIPIVGSMVDARIRGRVVPLELGDQRAPMMVLFVFPRGESITDTLRETEAAISGVPSGFLELSTTRPLDRIVFSSMQQSAIYEEYAKLQDGTGRDTQLASYVLAGQEPSAALGSEFQGLKELNQAEASRVADSYLRFDQAKVLLLHPSERAKRGQGVELTAPIHDLGQQRVVHDPTEATRPLAADPVSHVPAGVRTRVLPNGLKVVLLPSSSVPAIDMRLVFQGGTADEPPDRRGAALVAARALTFDPRFVNDLLVFAAAGGSNNVDIGTDHTAFMARGVDMHIDYLLAGLRRWVRDGIYDRRASSVLSAMRREAKRTEDDGAMTDRWRAAVFGEHHPYVEAGLVRRVSRGLSIDDAAKFRERYYTPDNATLVIAGRFDPALADRWIDYLFADWAGHSVPRRSERASPQAASIARDEATVQVNVQIAIPASSGGRAAQLVGAAVLSEIAGDVRHQLGASYGFNVQLSETRLANNYLIVGAVDAARATEAVTLLRARMLGLRTDADGAARAFVSARAHVLTRLVSVGGTAESLSARIENDVSMTRSPLTDLETAAEVRHLTIGDMAATLAELDLSRAIVLMRGPRADLDRSFAALERTATYVEAPNSTADNVPAMTAREDADESTPTDVEAPMTMQKLTPAFTGMIGLSTASGSLLGHVVVGWSVAGHVAYRVSEGAAVGVAVSVGYLEGTYGTKYPPTTGNPLNIVPLGVLGVVQLAGFRRLWGAAMAGLILDIVSDDPKPAAWFPSIGVGIEGGIDVLKLAGGHRFGVFGRIEGVFVSDTPYSATTLGIAYRQ